MDGHSDALSVRHDVIRNHLLFLVHLVGPAPHEALDREDCVLRIGHRLPLGDVPDQPLPRLREGDHRRRQPSTLGVRDDNRLSTFHDGNNRIGRPEVDPDDFAHSITSIRRSATPHTDDSDISIKVE